MFLLQDTWKPRCVEASQVEVSSRFLSYMQSCGANKHPINICKNRQSRYLRGIKRAIESCDVTSCRCSNSHFMGCHERGIGIKPMNKMLDFSSTSVHKFWDIEQVKWSKFGFTPGYETSFVQQVLKLPYWAIQSDNLIFKDAYHSTVGLSSKASVESVTWKGSSWSTTINITLL